MFYLNVLPFQENPSCRRQSSDNAFLMVDVKPKAESVLHKTGSRQQLQLDSRPSLGFLKHKDDRRQTTQTSYQGPIGSVTFATERLSGYAKSDNEDKKWREKVV